MTQLPTLPMPPSGDARHTVFLLWCRLTGTDPLECGPDERDAFLARPQVSRLAAMPYEVLLTSGISAARRGSLPLDSWLSHADADTDRFTVRMRLDRPA